MGMWCWVEDEAWDCERRKAVPRRGDEEGSAMACWSAGGEGGRGWAVVPIEEETVVARRRGELRLAVSV